MQRRHAKPSTAAPRKAPRQPKLAARNRSVPGATAEPRIPAEGMDRIGLAACAAPRPGARAAHNRPGGRPYWRGRAARTRDEHPERRGQAGDRERAGAEHETADQHRARADAIHQEPGRSLHRGRDHVERDQRDAELDVAHAELVAHQRKQRRQHQDVVMADEMRRADQGDDPVSVARVVSAVMVVGVMAAL